METVEIECRCKDCEYFILDLHNGMDGKCNDLIAPYHQLLDVNLDDFCSSATKK